MMKKVLQILLVLLSLTMCSSINVSNFNVEVTNENLNDFILWEKGVKLKWNNFRGIPNYNSKHSAITSTLIKDNQVGLLKDKILIDVSTYFSIGKSWVKKEKTSKNLLNHEQLHWDIAELSARKLRKIYSTHKSESLNESFQYFNEKYDEMIKEKRLFQDLYDKETDYSINKKKQKEWERKISLLLREYEEYSSVHVEVERIQQ